MLSKFQTRRSLLSACVFVAFTSTSPSQTIAFSAPKSIPFPNEASYSPVGLTAGDVNGDGKTDLLLYSTTLEDAPVYNAQLQLLMGDGTGKFASSTLPITPRPFSQFLFADVNNDGRLDLLYIYGGSSSPAYAGAVEVWLGDGKGHFSKKSSDPLPVGTVTAELGDFNKDGKLDLAVLTANSTGGTASTSDTFLDIFLNEGDGTLLNSQTIHHQNAYEFLGPVGDFTGNGENDLILIASANNSFKTLAGHGDGTFSVPSKATYTFSGELIGSVAAANLKHDGKTDLVFQLGPPVSGLWRIVTLLAKPSGFSWYAATSIQPGWSSVYLDDLNGNGVSDLLDFNRDSGAVRVLRGEAGAKFGAEQYIGNGHWGGIVLAPLKEGELPSLFFFGTKAIYTGPGYLGVLANEGK